MVARHRVIILVTLIMTILVMFVQTYVVAYIMRIMGAVPPDTSTVRRHASETVMKGARDLRFDKPSAGVE
jgi:ABC-type transporter Mla subunit MlaD